MTREEQVAILKFNWAVMAKEAREIVRRKAPRTVIVVADMRDDIGREMAIGLGEMSAETIDKMVADYDKTETFPTMMFAIQLDGFRRFFESATGRQPAIPDTLPAGMFDAVLIADGKSLVTLMKIPPVEAPKPSSN